MIRWWDYIVAFLCADLMAGFLLMAFAAETWYTPIIGAGVAWFLWDSWNDFYCRWRLHYEESQQ